MPRPSLRRPFLHVPIALSVLAICGGISALQASPPTGALGTARLVAAPAGQGDAWTIGVVISLAPKAITYWRDPGEAGVPPTFDFSQSTNVARADVSYPAPQRIKEGDIDAIGYEKEVVFPVRVTRSAGEAPTIVRLKMDFATCERICLPAHADLTIALPPSANMVDATRIADAAARVPKILDAGAVPAVAEIKTEPGSVANWRITPKNPAATDELFAEGPDGFYLATKRDGDAFLVTVAEHPKDRPRPDAVRLTLVRSGGAVEFAIPMTTQ